MAQDFDALMADLGVKPMKKDKAPVPKKARSVPVKKKKPSASTRASTPPQDPSRAEALERTLAVAKEERASAEAKVTSLKKKNRLLKKEKVALESQLATPRPTVVETLERWGFGTAEERAALMRMDGWLERIISHPSLEDDVGLRTELEQNMVRVCADCEGPAGMKSIQVDAGRCVVCGGFDLAAAARMFMDAALVHGRLRIVVVGRTTDHHRMIRRFLNPDKRIVLTQLPGDIRRDTGAAQTDVDHADAVIIWDESSLPEELLAVYRQSVRCGVVSAGSIGALLDEGAKIISGD